jgi:hypothetical protein
MPVRLLRRADAIKKNELYAALGVSLRYQPLDKKVVVEACPVDWCTKVRVGGGTRTPTRCNPD